MKRFKFIVPSIVAIIFCMMLIAGSTFALFTSQATASIEVTSGKVNVEAKLEKVSLSHVIVDEEGQIEDENGAHYSRSTDNKLWYEEALTDVSDSSIKLDRIVPGDRAEYKLVITNNSNVNIKYRVKFSVNESGYSLARGLELTFGTAISAKQAIANYQSAWMELSPAVTPENVVEYSIILELPLQSGNKYQELGATYSFLVEAVQGNAATSGEAVTNYIKGEEKELDTTTVVNKTVDTTTDPEKTTTTTQYTDVTVVEVIDNETQEKTTITKLNNTKELSSDNSDNAVKVTIPENTQLNNGTSNISLLVAKTDSAQSTFVLESNESLGESYDVDIIGLAADNNVELTVSIPAGDSVISKIIHVKDDNSIETLVEGTEATTTTFVKENGYLVFKTTSFSSYNLIVDNSWQGEVAELSSIARGENGEFLVKTPAELQAIAYLWANGQSTLQYFADGDINVEILADLDMNNKWVSKDLDGYNGTNIVYINGNNHTISRLNSSLIHGGFAGGCGFDIEDLTIANSNIVEVRDSQGVGAFAGNLDAVDLAKLVNCKLINSTVENNGTGYAGGLIGWTSGWNKVNDGPVDEQVYVEGCVVENCRVAANGSVGGVIGHSGANPATYTIVKNCTIKNNTLVVKEDKSYRVGTVFGTVNIGVQNDIINCTISGNICTAYQTSNADNREYGRLALGDTGHLTINGSEIQ